MTSLCGDPPDRNAFPLWDVWASPWTTRGRSVWNLSKWHLARLASGPLKPCRHVQHPVATTFLGACPGPSDTHPKYRILEIARVGLLPLIYSCKAICDGATMSQDRRRDETRRVTISREPRRVMINVAHQNIYLKQLWAVSKPKRFHCGLWKIPHPKHHVKYRCDRCRTAEHPLSEIRVWGRTIICMQVQRTTRPQL